MFSACCTFPTRQRRAVEFCKLGWGRNGIRSLIPSLASRMLAVCGDVPIHSTTYTRSDVRTTSHQVPST